MEIPSISQLTQDIERLNTEMANPDVLKNGRKVKELSRSLQEKESLLEVISRLKAIEKEQADVASMAHDGDAELAALAAEDAAHLEEEKAALEEKLARIMVPQDPLDKRNVILEIRAGTGGEESALFAAELYRAYARYAEENGWNMAIVSKSSSEQGGFKEVVAEVSGEHVFGTLKYERGVHRVQRVPETEKMGRVHTSTVTVAVLPEAEDVDIEIRPEDLRIDTYRASGAGGQHVNKTSSAIRITHIPTNTVVACQEERSQHKNKEKAMKLLKSHLLDAQERARQEKEASERRNQIGTGDRSEKIRTYNYPQDRITDHRIKQSWSNIPAVMEGDLGEIFESLAQHAYSLAPEKEA